jgi:hypothetical protein
VFASAVVAVNVGAGLVGIVACVVDVGMFPVGGVAEGVAGDDTATGMIRLGALGTCNGD